MPAVERKCCQCGALIPLNDDRRKLFCSGACKVASKNLDLKRAVALMPLFQVWRGARLKGGDKAAAQFAFREACALLDRYNAQDRASGRNALPGVQRKIEQGWRACDLEGKQKPGKEPWEEAA